MRRYQPNVLTFILYGLLFDTVVNLWKPFSIKFLERLGGGALEIALLNALPGLVAAVVLLPGAAFLSRFTNTKKATAAFIIISRALLLVIACIPMLPAAVRPMLFVVLVALMNCPDALSQTALQSFLGSVFGGHTRAQAITLRNQFGNAVVPIITIVTGLAITYIPATEQQRIGLYQLFFVGAFFLGLLEVFMFRRFKEPDAPQSAGSQKAGQTEAGSQKAGQTDAGSQKAGQTDAGSQKAGVTEAGSQKADTRKVSAPARQAPTLNAAMLKNILRDKRFTTFFLPMLLFAFFWQAGWPLCGIYQVENIKANELWFAIFSLASGAGAFATAGFWQKFIRKRGNTVTLLLSSFLLGFNLLLFPLSPNAWVLALVSPFSGFVTIGLNSAMLNGVLEATPDENRLVYLAFYNTAMNISLFLAPLFAHALLSAGGIYRAFYIVVACRLAAAGVIALTRRPARKAA